MQKIAPAVMAGLAAAGLGIGAWLLFAQPWTDGGGDPRAVGVHQHAQMVALRAQRRRLRAWAHND